MESKFYDDSTLNDSENVDLIEEFAKIYRQNDNADDMFERDSDSGNLFED